MRSGRSDRPDRIDGAARPRRTDRSAAPAGPAAAGKWNRLHRGEPRRVLGLGVCALVARAGLVARVGVVGLVGLAMLAGVAAAGTTGKLAGRITDPKGAPIAFVVVQIPGTPHMTQTDEDGRYTILQIDPGSYEVAISHIAYTTLRTQGIEISSDQTTRHDAKLEESTIQFGEVVVQAERPIVDVHLTSTRSTVSGEDIAELPVQELQDVVNLQAGVVDGHFRGGRIGEVQFQVDGVSVNNPYNNESSLKIDRSILQEVQVISGVFDAEYGQAMSGVVNAVLKDGGREFEWNAEAFAGGYYFPGNDTRMLEDDIQPLEIQNYQIGLSGPTPLPKTTFLVSGRRYVSDDYVQGERRFTPFDSSRPDSNIYRPTGDGEQVALGYTREWSGIVKVTNTSIPRVKASYQAIFNQIDSRRADWSWRFNPDGISTQEQISVVHGLDWSHTVGANTYYDLSIRQNYLDYSDKVFDDVWDSRYDAAGQPVSDGDDYEDGAVFQGVQLTRFDQKTDALSLKLTATSQVRPEHLAKAGFEGLFPALTFGTPGHLVYSTGALIRHVDEPPDYPGVQTYHPVVAAAFAQDQMEWQDFTVRAGLRLEYFDARTTVPSDLANPANTISGAPPSSLEETEPKVALAPRLGMAYPINERAGIHFAYGHFYQYPPLGEIFSNADYSVLNDLQAGSVRYLVMGNPDVKAEHTVQYELGYKQAVTNNVGLEVGAFYKDIRDLLGVEFLTTYNGAEYARLTNADFGEVLGFTIALDQRDFGLLSTSLDYTWQYAQGNSSDPRETATRAEAGEDPRPRLVPLNWDQRHTFNLTAILQQPGEFSLSGILRVGSGQPYTPILDTGFGAGLVTNSGRKPTAAVIDLRGERKFAMSGMRLTLFGRVFNLFDVESVNGFVFPSTGSPFYSRFPQSDRYTLADPSRFYQPRRLEIGVSARSGD